MADMVRLWTTVVISSTRSTPLGFLLLLCKIQNCSLDVIVSSVATILFCGPNLSLLHSLIMLSYENLQQMPVLYGGGSLKVSILFFRLRIV